MGDDSPDEEPQEAASIDTSNAKSTVNLFILSIVNM